MEVMVQSLPLYCSLVPTEALLLGRKPAVRLPQRLSRATLRFGQRVVSRTLLQ